MIVLPRQARDKQRESAQKEMRCPQDGVLLRPSTPLGTVEASWRASFDDLVPR